MTLDAAKAEIRQIIHDAPDGGFFPEQRSRLDSALTSLRSVVRSYQQEHVRELEDWIVIYESPQKMRRYSGGHQQVRVWMLGCLDKIGWHDESSTGSAI